MIIASANVKKITS